MSILQEKINLKKKCNGLQKKKKKCDVQIKVLTWFTSCFLLAIFHEWPVLVFSFYFFGKSPVSTLDPAVFTYEVSPDEFLTLD